MYMLQYIFINTYELILVFLSSGVYYVVAKMLK